MDLVVGEVEGGRSGGDRAHSLKDGSGRRRRRRRRTVKAKPMWLDVGVVGTGTCGEEDGCCSFLEGCSFAHPFTQRSRRGGRGWGEGCGESLRCNSQLVVF